MDKIELFKIYNEIIVVYTSTVTPDFYRVEFMTEVNYIRRSYSIKKLIELYEKDKTVFESFVKEWYEKSKLIRRKEKMKKLFK